MVHILAVDDNATVREVISQTLRDEGYRVKLASGGNEALDMIEEEQPDLLILDIVMPEMDGIQVCRQIRANPYLAKMPIIFLTSKNRPRDIAASLDAGGDDYLTKTSVQIELPARVRALLRRMPGGALDPDSEYITTGKLKLHTVRLEVHIDDKSIHLTPIEHRLLRYLMLQAGQPVSTDRLLEDVWNFHPGVGDPKLVRVTITRLRSKLAEAQTAEPHILTIRGQGYLVPV